MRTFEVRQIFMPYCLERLEDGSYLFLNRRYKPLGVSSEDFVDYELAVGRFKFKRALSAKQIASLSHSGSTEAGRIYLYDDGCIPTSSDAAWTAYSAKLKRLAGYEVVPHDLTP